MGKRSFALGTLHLRKEIIMKVMKKITALVLTLVIAASTAVSAAAKVTVSSGEEYRDIQRVIIESRFGNEIPDDKLETIGNILDNKSDNGVSANVQNLYYALNTFSEWYTVSSKKSLYSCWFASIAFITDKATGSLLQMQYTGSALWPEYGNVDYSKASVHCQFVLPDNFDPEKHNIETAVIMAESSDNENTVLYSVGRMAPDLYSAKFSKNLLKSTAESFITKARKNTAAMIANVLSDYREHRSIFEWFISDGKLSAGSLVSFFKNDEETVNGLKVSYSEEEIAEIYKAIVDITAEANKHIDECKNEAGELSVEATCDLVRSCVPYGESAINSIISEIERCGSSDRRFGDVDGNGKAGEIDDILAFAKMIQETMVEKDLLENQSKFRDAIISSTNETTLFGDPDGDGRISVNDAILILKIVVGWDVEVDDLAADMNLDGNVNVADAIYALKLCAGWDVKSPEEIFEAKVNEVFDLSQAEN